MPQTINLPPASDQTIKPAGGQFAFYMSQTANVCFGTATPPGSFPELENQTFLWQVGSTHTFPIPSVSDRIPYNTSAPTNPCTLGGIIDTGRVIIVGSGVTGRKRSRKKSKKAPAKKKVTAKKTGSKSVAKKKPAKKAARKAASKSAKKGTKKAGKKKAAKKSRR